MRLLRTPWTAIRSRTAILDREEEDEEDQSVERASAGGNTWQCPNKHEA